MAVLGAGSAWIASTALSSSKARADIEARLSRLADAPVHIDGRAEFRLLPKPRIDLTDVRAEIGRGERALDLDIDRVEARFDLVDALLGRVGIRQVVLIRPELGLAQTTDRVLPAPLPPPAPAPAPAPAGNGVIAREAAEATDRLRLFLSRFQGINELEIRDGLADLPDLRGPISNASVTLRWPEPAQAAEIEGSFVWNGQPASVDLALASPLRFMDGAPTPLSLTVASPMLAAAFEGTGAGGSVPRLEGSLRLSTPSLSRALRWLGQAPITTPDFGAFAIDTHLRLTGDSVALDAAALDLGGNEGRGLLETTVFAGRPPLLSGTLAFRRLDFGALASAVAPRPRTPVDLQRPFRTRFLHGIDLDLRLSADEALFGDLQATEVAAAAKIAGGLGAFDVSDMAVLGGRGQIRLAASAAAGSPRLRLSTSLRDIRVAGLSVLQPDAFPLTAGTGSLDLAMEGPACNWGALLGTGQSTLSLRVADGTLLGLRREDLGRAGEHQATRTAELPFSQLELKIGGQGSRLLVDELRLLTGAGTVNATGTVDATSGRMKLEGDYRATSLAAADPGAAFTSSKPVGLTLEGEWPDPVLVMGSAEKPM
mgnify:CR=1 FL=1